MNSNTPPPPDATPAPWDSIAVRDRVREAQARDIHPAELFLGRAEADALRSFLQEQYGDDAPASFRNTYYLGLKVRETDDASRLEVCGSKHSGGGARLAPLWNDGPGNQDRAA